MPAKRFADRWIGLASSLAASPAAAMAAQEVEAESRSTFSLLVGWIPVLIVIGVWLWYMRRSGIRNYGKLQARSMEHMEKVELQNEQLAETLGRIEALLRERK